MCSRPSLRTGSQIAVRGFLSLRASRPSFSGQQEVADEAPLPHAVSPKTVRPAIRSTAGRQSECSTAHSFLHHYNKNQIRRRDSPRVVFGAQRSAPSRSPRDSIAKTSAARSAQLIPNRRKRRPTVQLTPPSAYTTPTVRSRHHVHILHHQRRAAPPLKLYHPPTTPRTTRSRTNCSSTFTACVSSCLSSASR